MLKDSSTPLVIIAQELSLPALLDLIHGRAVAVRIPGFYAPDIARLISEKLCALPAHGKYVNAPEISRVGHALYETVGHPELEGRYFQDAEAVARAQREACYPYVAPFDKVRMAVDELAPQGATILRDCSGRRCFAGLTREFACGAEAEPHTDCLEWDAPHLFNKVPIAQIAGNVYLRVGGGGDLTIWPGIRPDRDQYETLRRPGSYGLRRELLTGNVVTIRPAVGELVLFDARCVHAVERTLDSRVAVSFFIVIFADGTWCFYS
jgi:hypothetical protein